MDRGPFNLCFSGDSFLGVYDIGSAVCLLDHGKRVLQRVKTYGGISTGAFTAAIMISAPERLLSYLQAVLALSDKIHGLPQGVLTPGFDLMAELRHIVAAQLRPDANQRCSQQLHIPLQELVTTDDIPVQMRRRPQNLEEELQPLRPPVKSDTVKVGGKDYLFGDKHVVTEYSTKEALIEVLLAASYYPSIPSMGAPQVMGKHYIDLSALSGTPGDAADCGFPPNEHVIMISPNKQAGYAKPQDNLTLGLRDVSRENYVTMPWHMFRLGNAVFPPPKEELEKKFFDGVQDAKEFLRKFRMYDEGEDSFPMKLPIL